MQSRGLSLVALAVCLTGLAAVPAAGQDASQQAVRITVSPDRAPRGRLARITYELDEPAAYQHVAAEGSDSDSSRLPTATVSG
jgi:hypothetical protein